MLVNKHPDTFAQRSSIVQCKGEARVESQESYTALMRLETGTGMRVTADPNSNPSIILFRDFQDEAICVFRAFCYFSGL